MPIGSTAGKNAYLDACFGANKASGFASTVYFSLFHGDPNSGGTELTSTGGYVRLSLANNGTNFGAASSGQKTNAAVWNMAASTAAYSGTTDYWALYDASSGGNMLANGQLLDLSSVATTVTVSTAGVILQFAIGAVIITIT